MIDLDYLIERKIKDDTILKLVPDKIPSKLPNIVYVEGPNDSGKSTILNLIALSFYGLNNDRIKDSLKIKMDSLINSDYQKIKFELEISNKDKSIILRARKKDLINNEIIVEESINGNKFRPLSRELFEKKYNLIYDIPEKPTERLPDLLSELESQQIRYGEQIKRFSKYIRDMIVEIKEYRDPKRLDQLKNSLKQLIEEVEEINIKLPTLSLISNDLKMFNNVRNYIKYYNDCLRLNEKICEYEENIRKYKKGEKIKSAEYSSLKSQISFQLDEIFKIKNNITTTILNLIFKKDKKKLIIWEDIKIYDTKDYEIDKKLKSQIKNFLFDINEQMKKIENDDSFKNSSIFKDIIKFLKSYENFSIEIPKINIKLSDLINILTEENKKHDKILTMYEGLKSLNTSLDTLLSSIDEINILLLKLKEYDSKGVDEDTGEDISAIRELLNGYRDNYNISKRQLNYYYLRCKEYNIEDELLNEKMKDLLDIFNSKKDLEPFFTLDEKQLIDKITEFDREILKMDSDLKTKGFLIKQYGEEFEKLKKKKSHKYENNLTELDILYKKSEELHGKLLNDYTEMIKKLKKSKILNITSEEKIYYNKIAKYLGNKIGTFWYIDKKYIAKEVDLISKIIYTEDGSIIHISDLGTGRGQAAYLTGLLNLYNDNRNIIALFDEISAMDFNSLTPIISKIQKLYEDNLLLTGVLVQKLDEKIKITSLEGYNV
jgi:hypothetical protein